MHTGFTLIKSSLDASGHDRGFRKACYQRKPAGRAVALDGRGVGRAFHELGGGGSERGGGRIGRARGEPASAQRPGDLGRQGAPAAPSARTSSGPSTYTSARVGRSANSAAAAEPPGRRVARSTSPAPSCHTALPSPARMHSTAEDLHRHRVRLGDQQPGAELRRARRRRTGRGQHGEMVEVCSFVNAAPDLLRQRGRGGGNVCDRDTQPRQAHPGAPSQPAAYRQAHRDVSPSRRWP